MIRLKLHIVFLFSLIGLPAFAQNLKADYKLCHRASDSLIAFVLEEIHYQYDSLNQGGEISKCLVRKNKEAIQISVASIERITTQKQILVIDHEDQLMSLYKIADSTKKQLNEDTLIDKFLNTFDSIVFLGQKDNLKNYALYSKENDVKETHLFFNTESNLLVKVIEYNRYPYLNDGMAKNIVVYSYSALNSDAKEEISIEKYIELKNGRYSLKNEYQNYELEAF